LVDTFLGFSQNSFEERQAATCPYSKEFCENPVNVSTNRKKGIKIIRNKKASTAVSMKDSAAIFRCVNLPGVHCTYQTEVTYSQETRT
jgi:hypothetical protein